MSLFIQMLLTALMAVTAENILFAGGIGISRVLRAARRPRTIAVYSLFITVFSLASILLGSILNPLLAANQLFVYVKPVVFAMCAAVVYFVAAAVLKFVFPRFYSAKGEILAPAAMNTVVLAMPFLQKSLKMSLTDATAFAIGTGIAFFLAAIILAHTISRFKNDDMPKAFAGLPAILIYVGILSLAFAGFSGGKLF